VQKDEPARNHDDDEGHDPLQAHAQETTLDAVTIDVGDLECKIVVEAGACAHRKEFCAALENGTNLGPATDEKRNRNHQWGQNKQDEQMHHTSLRHGCDTD
jgi:hypothetical protein